MIDYVLVITSFFFTIYGLYYAITGLFAFLKTKKKETKRRKKHFFSIIIAARNEENVIGNLIHSLKKLNYDKNYYDINVFVNNSTDGTFRVAQEMDVNTINCDFPVHSKGEVLRYVFKNGVNPKTDAYVIFDADNVVHPDFLKYMNESLNQGYNVAQGFRDSKNYRDNWISGSYTLFYYLQNFFFNLSRKKINSSASINGTGFMVSRKFIEKIDFDPQTLTEDVELTTVCAILNEKIDFADKAITYDEQPTNFRVSLKQRLRWSKGNLQCWKRYHTRLIKSFIKNKNMSCIDMYLNNLAAFIQVVSIAMLIVSFCAKVFTTKWEFSLFGIAYMGISYLFTLIVTLFVTIYNKKSVPAMIPSLLLFTLFLITWFPINIISLFKKSIKWDHIGHNKSVSIDDIVKG